MRNLSELDYLFFFNFFLWFFRFFFIATYFLYGQFQKDFVGSWDSLVNFCDNTEVTFNVLTNSMFILRFVTSSMAMMNFFDMFNWDSVQRPKVTGRFVGLIALWVKLNINGFFNFALILVERIFEAILFLFVSFYYFLSWWSWCCLCSFFKWFVFVVFTAENLFWC